MRSRRLAVIGAIVLWNRNDRGSLARSGAGTGRPGPPIADPLVQTGSVTAGSGAIPVYGSSTVRPRAEIHVAPLLQRADDEVFVTGAQREGQAVITGGLQFATEVMRVQIGTDPVR